MPLPPHRSAVIDGATVTWRERGNGPPMVLIHGIGGSSDSWRPAFDALAPAWHVIAWDAPGYGGSSLDATTFTAQAYADRLLSLLHHLDAAPHHIVAHSIGSPIAASLYRLLPPDFVKTMTLVHPVPGFGGMGAEQRDALRAARLADIDGMAMPDFGTLRAPQIVGPNTDAAIIDEAAAIIGRIPEAGYRAMVEVMSSADLVADLPSLSVPTLVIAGTADAIAPPDACRAIATALPSGTYEEYDGVGHYAPLERPDAFLSSVRRLTGHAGSP
jgi:pimeloyl-ACP methyl ester carboxylesterase